MMFSTLQIINHITFQRIFIQGKWNTGFFIHMSYISGKPEQVLNLGSVVSQSFANRLSFICVKRESRLVEHIISIPLQFLDIIKQHALFHYTSYISS